RAHLRLRVRQWKRARGARPRAPPRGMNVMPDINTDKVCFVIVKARELESDASNATDDKFVSVMTDDAYDSVRAELAAYIDAMDEDEQCELVALCWIGRGEYTAEEWR